jgi:hypothetical protein
MRLASLVLSSSALFLALATLLYTVFSPGKFPGKGLSSYDLSTPAAAVKSWTEMEANNDFRASIEYRIQRQGPLLKEKHSTLHIEREADFEGKKLLFVSYEVKGKKKYSIEAFEQDDNAKIWAHSFVSSYDVQKVDERLSGQMKAWESLNEEDEKTLTPPRRITTRP